MWDEDGRGWEGCRRKGDGMWEKREKIGDGWESGIGEVVKKRLRKMRRERGCG